MVWLKKSDGEVRLRPSEKSRLRMPCEWIVSMTPWLQIVSKAVMSYCNVKQAFARRKELLIVKYEQIIKNTILVY